jgi:hypothetical protein
MGSLNRVTESRNGHAGPGDVVHEMAWRTDSAFLLICANGRSHVVHSADPAATALIARLRVRPGFDADRVLGPEGPVRSRMLTVWRRPGSRRGIDGPCIPAPRSVTGPGGRSR